MANINYCNLTQQILQQQTCSGLSLHTADPQEALAAVQTDDCTTVPDLAAVQHIHVEQVLVLALTVVHDIDVEKALVLVQDIHERALELVAANSVDSTAADVDVPALPHHSYYLHLDILI